MVASLGAGGSAQRCWSSRWNSANAGSVCSGFSVAVLLGDVHEGDAVGEAVGRVAKVAGVGLGERRVDGLDEARVLVGRVGLGAVADDHVPAHVALPRSFAANLTSRLAECKLSCD